jgi:hypothetical protein
MTAVSPDQAGAASGALTTMQNVGNAMGVSIVGVVFFDTVPPGFAHAFQLSLAMLAALLLVEGAAPELLQPPVNVMRLALHPDGVAPHPQPRRVANARAPRCERLDRRPDRPGIRAASGTSCFGEEHGG